MKTDVDQLSRRNFPHADAEVTTTTTTTKSRVDDDGRQGQHKNGIHLFINVRFPYFASF